MAKAGVASAPITPDTGCYVSPACLDCPRSVCVLDDERPWDVGEDMLISALDADAVPLLAFRSVEDVTRRLKTLRARPTFGTPGTGVNE